MSNSACLFVAVVIIRKRSSAYVTMVTVSHTCTYTTAHSVAATVHCVTVGWWAAQSPAPTRVPSACTVRRHRACTVRRHRACTVRRHRACTVRRLCAGRGRRTGSRVATRGGMRARLSEQEGGVGVRDLTHELVLFQRTFDPATQLGFLEGVYEALLGELS